MNMIRVLEDYQQLLGMTIREINWERKGKSFSLFARTEQKKHLTKWIEINDELRRLGAPYYTKDKIKELENLII